MKDANWNKEESAKLEAVQKLVDDAGKELPKDYLDLLLYCNGGEGELGIKPGWFRLWSAEDVIQLNKDYEIEKYIPEFFGFGSSGGGELIAFDMQKDKSWKIVMIPFVSMSPDEARIIANNFEEFVKAIGRRFDY
ncbi:MAG: SMI1/KNR4 family protein [Anaerolineales bacterium]|uniref:SMI1/KNR4 family protein n=1 Tax=Candidatus Villigracilis proximus TaxID=3140683 RepID=UPI00313735C8|nr:SMI1/KNR4 family protein [Anaerolineales bacterium]